MKAITIDLVFEDLILPMTDKEYSGLKAEIFAEACRGPPGSR